jgi:flagellar basal-body rod protein FlgF
MSTDVYVALSGQIALQRRLETIANNIANMSTVGYRADEIKFDAMIAKSGTDQVAFASSGTDFVSRRAGEMVQTGNPLDVAVRGSGWFAYSDAGKTFYSRDGRLHMNDLGELQSVKGYPILDVGGSPITVDPSGGPVTVSEEGSVMQGGKSVGQIGLFEIPSDALFTRHDNSGLIPDKPATPVEDMTLNGVRQGFVEGANINPINEMVKLIAVSRAFENAAAAIQTGDSTTESAIKTLGPS